MSLWDIASGIGELLTLSWRRRKDDDAIMADAARKAYQETEEGRNLHTLEDKIRQLEETTNATKRDR